jgi:anti-anti-sigma factor
MALYRVTLPFADASPGGGVRYTTIEVEADSEAEARRLALNEFAEMSDLGSAGPPPRIIEKDIKYERAPVARRATLDIASRDLPGGIVVLRLVGSLNSSNFMQFQEILDQTQTRGVKKLIIDLSGLTYVNSTGLSLFVAAGDMFAVSLAAVPSRILRLLKMIGLDKLFPTFGTVAEIVKS